MLPRLLLLSGLLLLGGCLWPVREKTDQAVHDIASHPFDLAPETPPRDMPRAPEAVPPPKALPAGPAALPGPAGRPYTLADLQHLAADNSPALRQAAADVETARGNLVQARAYPNPTVGYTAQPSNNNSTTAAQGFFFDQVIRTFGKQ